MTIFSELIPKEQAKPRNSQSFHERGLTGYFKRCCLRARLLIYQASKAVIFASPGKVEDTSHTSFQPVPIIKPNYQELCRRSLYTHLGPKYYSRDLKAPGSLGPNSQQDLCSCISQDCSKQTVLNGCRSTSTPTPTHCGYTPWPNTEEMGKNVHLPFFFQKTTQQHIFPAGN